MFETFNFGRVPDIYFGMGKFSLLPNLIKAFGQRVLVLTGRQSFLKSPYWTTMQELFEMHELNWTLTTVTKEPTPEIINKITHDFKNANIELVLAIGGGSVIDAGKAVAAMLPLQDKVEHYLDEFGAKFHSGYSLPLVVVPTTAGTGSETTRYAMLSEVAKDGRGTKQRLYHSHFVPKIAVLDTNLVLTCPPQLTAYGGLNIFSQLLESFLSFGANQLTDTLAFKGIHYVIRCLPISYKDGSNAPARSGMMYASMVSGVTSSNAGLGLVHGLAGAISGDFDIPYSLLCASLMAKTHEVTIQEARKYPEAYKETLDKYARVGNILHKSRGKSRDYYKDILNKATRRWTDQFKVPKLREYGVTPDHFSDIIAHTDFDNHPVPMEERFLKEILEACW